MKASFAPTGHEGTIVQPAEGHVLTVNVAGGRVVILVDEYDYEEAIALQDGVVAYVTDLMTDESHRLRRAQCGLECFCGVEFVA